MKAIRVHAFGDPSVMKLEDVPDPKPAAGQVLIKVEAAGVNPVETYVRKGIYGPREFPYTPGSDAAGIVESIGPGVKRFKPGDRVYTAGSLTGAYATKALCAEAMVHPLPDGVSFEEGAALGVPYATAYFGLYFRGHAEAGEKLLVHGASGSVGLAAVQFARAAGLTIFGTAGTEKGLQLISDHGVHHALNHHEKDYLKKLMDLTGGSGVNLILEMAAHINLGKDLTVLDKYGRVVVIGSRGPVEITPRDTMIRQASILGMSLMTATERQLQQIHAAIGAGLEYRTLRPVIGQRIPLAEAPRAHEAVMAPGANGKIVLVP
jgi:NADPH2:quinone reductase